MKLGSDAIREVLNNYPESPERRLRWNWTRCIPLLGLMALAVAMLIRWAVNEVPVDFWVYILDY